MDDPFDQLHGPGGIEDEIVAVELVDGDRVGGDNRGGVTSPRTVSAPQNHAAVVERAGGFGSRRAFSGLIGCAGVRRGGIACARLGRGVR